MSPTITRSQVERILDPGKSLDPADRVCLVSQIIARSRANDERVSRGLRRGLFSDPTGETATRNLEPWLKERQRLSRVDLRGGEAR